MDGQPVVPDFVVDFGNEATVPGVNPSIQVNNLGMDISTDNKAYDQKTYTIDIVCTSQLSNSANKIATTTVEIKLVDECYSTVISPPTMSGGSISLYETFTSTMTPATSSKSACNPIYYTISLID